MNTHWGIKAQTLYRILYFGGKLLSYYLFQDEFKNPKIMKIQQVHQKIHTKQFLLCCLTCFVFVVHLNLKRLRLTGEAQLI